MNPMYVDETNERVYENELKCMVLPHGLGLDPIMRTNDFCKSHGII